MSIINGQGILRDKLHQNRIKTGAIFDDLLLSQKKQEVRGPPERIKQEPPQKYLPAKTKLRYKRGCPESAGWPVLG
jgi:hypothetical protein